MKQALLEFFVEPFTEGHPGPHVIAAIKAVENLGLEIEVGPFNNRVAGPPESLVEAATAVLGEAVINGASRVSLQLSADGTGGEHRPGLHNALVRLIRQVEATLGAPLTDLSREEKQAAVRMLDEQGAFLLRRSIDEVAGAMGVSRITIYNYLNAIRE